MAVRRWFADEMAADGLAVTSDAAGNVFGRFGPADGAVHHGRLAPRHGAGGRRLRRRARRRRGARMRAGDARRRHHAGDGDRGGGDRRGGRPLRRHAGLAGDRRSGVAATGSTRRPMPKASGWPTPCAPAASTRTQCSSCRRAPDSRSAPFWNCTSSRGRCSRRPAFRSASPSRSPASACSSSASTAPPTIPARRRWTMRADAFAGLAEIAASIPALIAEAWHRADACHHRQGRYPAELRPHDSRRRRIHRRPARHGRDR